MRLHDRLIVAIFWEAPRLAIAATVAVVGVVAASVKAAQRKVERQDWNER